MNKKRSNKRSLALSLLSMLMCVALLAGSTFAWFTDNASTSVNTIQAGTLDIQLLAAEDKDADSLEGKTLTFAKAEGAPEGEAVLFEPGAKYELTNAWLYNAGNLHAKYQVVITGIDGDSKLAEVLDVYVNGESVGKTLADLAGNGGIIKGGDIAPKAFDTFGTIALMMQTTAGNDYQGLSLSGIAITVQATQAAVEYDSTNNTYDVGATYDGIVAPSNQAELNAEINKIADNTPTTVVLPSTAGGEGFKLDDGGLDLGDKDVTFTGTKDTVIDLTGVQIGYFNNIAGADITFDGITVEWYGDNNNGTRQGLKNAEKVVYKNCTIKGLQFMYSDAEFINCTFESYNDYAVWTYGNNVTFTDCTFNTGGKAILLYHEDEVHATVTVTNCTFNSDGTLATDKAAVEVGSSERGPETTYEIIINNSTADTFAENPKGTATGSKLWGNKHSMDKDHLNVIIDGVDVY